ncbi:hypothetical protein [Micromonospora sp. NPDC023633]|uniref:hypothetical protein n=1 Tax=Micromonospora sp. NPDC023633 TaxID=3154320 RepID=UPI00340E9CD9
MIGSNIIGNDLVEAAAEFAAAKARLELWMGHIDPPLPLRRQFEIGRAASEAVRTIYESWIKFESAHRSAGGKVAMVDDERSVLLVTIRKATAELGRIPEGRGE